MTVPRGAGRFDPYGRTVPLPPAVAPRPAEPMDQPDARWPDLAPYAAEQAPARPIPGPALSESAVARSERWTRRG
ncbi:MAG: hypothetical protein ACR2J8_00660, partial [Thermomicrobiales bacterium]